MKLVYRGKEYDTSSRTATQGSALRTYRGVKYSASQESSKTVEVSGVYRGIKTALLASA